MTGVQTCALPIFSGTAWSDTAAWDGIVTATAGNPVLTDLVTIANAATSFSVSKFCTANTTRPGSWVQPDSYINGNLLVIGTVGADRLVANSITAGQIAANSITADKIDSRNLTIKDGSGNVIFSAGQSVPGNYLSTPSLNLVAGLARWSLGGTLWIYAAENFAADRRSLIIPGGQNFTSANSPSMSLASGQVDVVVS